MLSVHKNHENGFTIQQPLIFINSSDFHWKENIEQMTKMTKPSNEQGLSVARMITLMWELNFYLYQEWHALFTWRFSIQTIPFLLYIGVPIITTRVTCCSHFHLEQTNRLQALWMWSLLTESTWTSAMHSWGGIYSWVNVTIESIFQCRYRIIGACIYTASLAVTPSA